MAYQGRSKLDVLLNVPNIIGYVRVSLYTWGIWAAQSDGYVIAASMFFVNCVMDALDGLAARRLNQCSKFGAIMDVILDVMQMSMWKTLLCQLYPEYSFWISLHAGLTIFAEWMHRHSTEVRQSKTHFQSDSNNPILRYYYATRLGHDFMVWSYWCFWLMLYITKYTQGPIVPGVEVGIWQLLLYVSFPCMINRFVIMLAKIYQSVNIMVECDIMAMAENGKKTRIRRGKKYYLLKRLN